MQSLGRTIILTAMAACLWAGCEDPRSDRPDGEGRQKPTSSRRDAKPAEVSRAKPRKPALREPTKRYGDAGQQRVPEEQAELYPQQDHWARAGVRGGIPADLEILAEVAPGEHLQKAIDSADAPGVVLLSEGEYRIAAPLKMKSGAVLRGAGPRTRIVFTAGDGRALIANGVSRVGVENLTLVYADPAGYADRTQIALGVYANAEGFTPSDASAIELTDANDCWVSDVTIRGALSHPLSVRLSEHCTLRGVTVDGVLNRGPQAGEVILGDSSYLLLNGWRVRGSRLIRLDGLLEWSVLRGSVLGCGVYFEDADRVRGMLFEDLHVLCRPGYMFDVFAKGPFPAGPDNLLINVSSYHQGTDAVGGLLPEEGKAYQIQKYTDRVVYDPAKDISKKTRFITPYSRLTTRRSLNYKPPVTLEPAWKTAPEGTDPIHLQSGRLLDDWMWTTAIEGDVLEVDPNKLTATPLQAGQQRSIAGTTVTVEHHPSPEQSWKKSNPANAQQMIGRFGVTAQPAGGSKVSFLKRVDENWKAGLVLQRLIDLPGEATVSMQLENTGTKVRVFAGSRESKENTPYTFAPGVHALTVLVKLYRPIDLITTAHMQLRFLHMPDEGMVREMKPVREPDNGFLYPYVGFDPLADQRAALAAWEEFRTGPLREVPLVNGADKARALAGKHPGTHAAWLLEGVARVLAEAPHEESDALSPIQWGELADYYHRRGLPERKWRINRIKKPAKYRQYYPDVEVSR